MSGPGSLRRYRDLPVNVVASESDGVLRPAEHGSVSKTDAIRKCDKSIAKAETVPGQWKSAGAEAVKEDRY
jgi:hypothetical protein